MDISIRLLHPLKFNLQACYFILKFSRQNSNLHGRGGGLFPYPGEVSLWACFKCHECNVVLDLAHKKVQRII